MKTFLSNLMFLRRMAGLAVVLLFAPSCVGAQTLNGANPLVTVLNPTLTSYTVPVVVNYCPVGTGQFDVMLMNINDNGNTTITSCSVPVLGNYYWVDANGTQQEDQSEGGFFGTAPAAWGWGYNLNDGGAACGPVTYIETLPPGLSNNCGTFDVVVAMASNYLGCGDGNISGHATVTVPCTNSAVTAVKSVQGDQAAAGDLLL